MWIVYKKLKYDAADVAGGYLYALLWYYVK